VGNRELQRSEFTILDSVRSALAELRERSGKPAGKREPLSILIAVSGGEDSHALLHLLWTLREEENLFLAIAHFDHALRPESIQEADFVRHLSIRYEMPYFSARASGRPRGTNIEAWARRVRYEFLERARRTSGAEWIATAHHLNDQAETVLFRILNGRFSTDANGIAACDPARALFRPLLRVSKLDIENYCGLHRLPFVVDSSNEDLGRTRNRIRKELLPDLQAKYNPQLVTQLGTLAERSSEDERFLSEEAKLRRARLPSAPLGRELKNLPPALRWRVICSLAEEQLGPRGRQLGFRSLSSVCNLLERIGNTRRRLDLGVGISCEVSGSSPLRFFDSSLQEEPAVSSPFDPAQLGIPGTVERHYSDGTQATITSGVLILKEKAREDVKRLIDWTRKRAREGNFDSGAVEYFDLENLSDSKLWVRERHNGDTIRVWRRGERKLKKLFLEHDVRPDVRDRIPLVQADSDLLWVPGVARAETAPISPRSRYLLELRYNRA